MTTNTSFRLKFNLGFLLEAGLGTHRKIEIDYPSVTIDEEITLIPLAGKFTATRTSKGILIAGMLHSFFPSTCSRCLEDMQYSIQIELNDLFCFRGIAEEGEYEIGEDGCLDMAPLVRELSILAVPIQAVCRQDCLGLCTNCGENLNSNRCVCKNDRIDPRLAALKQLL